jgi:hypothetical protein
LFNQIFLFVPDHGSARYTILFVPILITSMY